MSLFREGYVWKSADTYADALWERSQLRGWRLTKKYISSALSGIRDHQDVLHPTAVKLSLGKGAAYDWAEASAWLADSIASFDEFMRRYFDDCTMVSEHNGSGKNWFHYARNSGPKVQSGPELEPSYLDLDSFNLKEEVPWNDRPMMLDIINQREVWPGVDLVWLFAMNPEMYLNGWFRQRYVNFYLPGIVLTDDAGGDEEARHSWGSTGWGFVPELEWRGPVSSFGHRSSSVGPGMCFVSYAA